MLLLFAGLGLWTVYGTLIADPIIVVANAVGAGLVGAVLACKIRDIADRK